ncbi:hypothetical protein ACFVHB_34450 [Kitasatospora sp. NPDC127111]|uniref:hypothetical protein n=1 Tax=Kitasatospora sp. NPDC127111 TaxID=3345363 RepID=UPI00362CEF31
MDVVFWVLLVVAGCAASVGWRLWSFPGGWERAFAGTYAAERRRLAAARRAVRRLRWAAGREMAGARLTVHRRTAAHRQRVRAAQRHLDRLGDPGSGAVLVRFGGAALHEHVVAFDGTSIPLAGLRVRDEHSGGTSHLYLTRPDGRVHHETYAHGEHAEDDVRRFAVRVQNAAADENDFRERRTVMIAAAEADLDAARADTTARDRAREELAEITERHRLDTRLKAARAELAAARDHWHRTSGRRPR